MKNSILIFLVFCFSLAIITSCGDDDCTETTWYEDKDDDGLGNPDSSESACEQLDGFVANDTDTDDNAANTELHAAYAEFDSDNYTIYLDGAEVVLETNGHPNHVTPYWGSGDALYIDPVCTTTEQMAPGFIDNFSGSFTLRVPVSPALASSTSSTGLGAIGMAISGSVIYNDEEGPKCTFG